jgi:hypothetical protein
MLVAVLTDVLFALGVGGVAVLADSPAHRPPRPSADGTFGA